MGKVDIKIELLIQFYNNFFIGGGSGVGQIHSYLQRDINGLPFIPASSLKGCIAQSAYTLSALFPEVDREYLFGKSGTQHGVLYFEDGKLEKESFYKSMGPHVVDLKTGIKLSRYTKTKQEGQFYTMETSGQGGAMGYKSSIQGFLPEQTYQDNIRFLIAAIRFLFALGGGRSSGLGWLEKPIQCSVYKMGEKISPLVGEDSNVHNN